MQVRGIEKDTQVLVRMNKGNYIVRTRRARRCRADGERCALDFNLATSFSFSFFFFPKSLEPVCLSIRFRRRRLHQPRRLPLRRWLLRGNIYIYVCICVCTCEVNEQLFFNPRASTHKNYWFSPRTSPTHGRPCFLSWPTYMPPTRALTISTIPRLRRKRPTTPIVLGPYLPTYQTSRNRSPNQMAIRVTLPRLFSPKYSRTEVDDGALMVCS